MAVLEQHVTFCWLVDAGDRVEDGRLAGPVRTDDGEDLPLLDDEIDPVHSGDAAEPHRQLLDREDSHRKQRTEDRGQKTEDRGQKTEDRRQVGLRFDCDEKRFWFLYHRSEHLSYFATEASCVFVFFHRDITVSEGKIESAIRFVCLAITIRQLANEVCAVAAFGPRLAEIQTDRT